MFELAKRVFEHSNCIALLVQMGRYEAQAVYIVRVLPDRTRPCLGIVVEIRDVVAQSRRDGCAASDVMKADAAKIHQAKLGVGRVRRQANGPESDEKYQAMQ